MFIYFLSVAFYLCIYPVFKCDYLPLFNPISWSLDHCCSHMFPVLGCDLLAGESHVLLMSSVETNALCISDAHWLKEKKNEEKWGKKEDGVDSHNVCRMFALYGGAWRSVNQSCPPLCDPMDCSRLGASVHGISQARTLEQAAISFSSGPSQHIVS